MSERAEILVIGGGQAGLTAGYHLAQAELPFLILDAESRVGDSWRRRWDSLELFTTARYSQLPGLTFPGDPEHFPRKDEIADYLERYAHTFELPVRADRRVTSLERSGGGYRAATASGSYLAAHVIVATGVYQRPHVPAFAAKLSGDTTQLHSAEYRNPAQLPDGVVLVVGAANSGAQIAEDLASSHRVYLARGKRLPHLPHRILGHSLHWWGDHLGLIAAPLDSLARPHTARRAAGRAQPAPARAAHRHRAARARHRRSRPHHAVRRRTHARHHHRRVGNRLPPRLLMDTPAHPRHRGAPKHRRGVTDAPGLYFLGMYHQHSRGSALIAWVKDDAAYIVDHIRRAHGQPLTRPRV
jgi:putative flavoprotein involved in K+ transport